MDNATKLLELARQKFGTLTEAEQKFFKAVANGEVADYNAEVEENNNPANAAKWGPERVLKADRIAWLCIDLQASNLATHRGIQLKGVRIEGQPNLEYAKISFPLVFEKSSIPQGMNLRDAKIRELNLDSTHTGSIDGDGLTVDGGLFLSDGFEAQGEVRLIGATIRGDLDCEKARFINPKADALSGRGLKVEGCVYLRSGFKAEGEVCLEGAIVGGNFDCTNGQFSNKGTVALLIDQARVDGSIFLRDGFKSMGEVYLVGATAGGSLNCGNGEFINEHGRSLTADGLTVERIVRFDDGFNAKGEVRLIGAKIGGFLTCINGKFINPRGKALVADMAEVKGSVMLRHGFIAEGEVSLIDAKIGTNLECDGGQFINAKGRALNADKVNIKGNVFLRNGFKAEGLISFAGAVIDGGLVCVDTAKSKEMKLDLRSTKIGILGDEKGSWPENGKLFLHGFVYNNIDDNAPRDAKSRIDWLQRQASFRPQPYEQLAAVLRKSGDDAAAKKILIAKNKDKARLTKLTWSEWWWYLVFGCIIGYGYRPWRAAWIALVIVLLGWFFFWAGSRADVLTPAKKGAYVSDDSNKGWHLSEHYPTFFAPVYSLDVFVPLVDLHQASYWLPNANRDGQLTLSENLKLPISGKVLCYYFWFEIIAGWVLTTLLVVGVTGLVRK